MNDELLLLMRKFTDDYNNHVTSSKAITNALHRGGIFTIEDLKSASEEELRKIRWIGPEKLKIVLIVKESITKER